MYLVCFVYLELYASYITSSIIDSDQVPFAHCCWINVLLAETVGICSVYAPNDHGRRTQVSERMSPSFQTTEWIIHEDFNMLEWDVCGHANTLKYVEKHTWLHCMFPLGISYIYLR